MTPLDPDDVLLGQVLRRFISDGEYRYFSIGEHHLTLDASVDITEAEREALLRATRPDPVVSTGFYVMQLIERRCPHCNATYKINPDYEVLTYGPDGPGSSAPTFFLVMQEGWTRHECEHGVEIR